MFTREANSYTLGPGSWSGVTIEAGMTWYQSPRPRHAGVWISFSRFGRLLIDFESINAELRPGNGGIRPHLPLKVLFDFPTHRLDRIHF